METPLNKIVKIQHQIETLLNTNNDVTCHFIDDGYALKLVTFNPIHGETFLLHSESTKDVDSSDNFKLKAYENMFIYVKSLVNSKIESYRFKTYNMKSYTVIWSKSDGVENKSYFYAKDMWDVLTKFYFGKTPIINEFNILEIKLNPSA